MCLSSNVVVRTCGFLRVVHEQSTIIDDTNRYVPMQSSLSLILSFNMKLLKEVIPPQSVHHIVDANLL